MFFLYYNNIYISMCMCMLQFELIDAYLMYRSMNLR